MDLQAILSGIDVPADWVGLRYVKEDTGFRLVRDGKPEENTRESKQGIMVEVLVDGQFAYYGTSRLDAAGIQAAAGQAVVLAPPVAKGVRGDQAGLIEQVYASAHDEPVAICMLDGLKLKPVKVFVI
ncbi:MAG: hypothetical protein L3J79_03650 [Candidatus Marinimicrobia bacterium]|nr:hypothetical protein [Candidatus Neomarinimicrobiota bacterium]